jgi:hypothetical protein
MRNIFKNNRFIPITKILFSHSDHEAQPWGGPEADKNGGTRAEPPLIFILINSRLTVRRPLGSLTLALSGKLLCGLAWDVQHEFHGDARREGLDPGRVGSGLGGIIITFCSPCAVAFLELLCPTFGICSP